MYTTEQRRVLAVRPGITDYASIVYMDENRLLGQDLQIPTKLMLRILCRRKLNSI